MITVFKNSWALFLGMLLLQLGNGMQGTLLGVRGSIENMSPQTMSWVMAGYFLGFLGGSRITPHLIKRVGHVRVFAALASLASACLVLFAVFPNEYFWFVLRVLVGLSFSGVYVTAESWLNDASTNETRGKTLSLYLICQMMGIVTAQYFVNFGDPAGYNLFILISVVVSLSFAPILLSVSPAPVFQTSKPMSFKELWRVSPLGVVGNFLLGTVFAALFGMAPVFGTEKGMSVETISIFIASIYFGGMILQYPIGWISDRMDRRLLIIVVCALGASFAFAAPISSSFYWLIAVGFVIGGVSNPLYSLFIAYTNDFLEHDDMAAASGGLVFINGVGAVSGPIIVGWMIANLGADSFFIFIGSIMLAMGLYAVYRMTQRAAVPVDETISYAPVSPQSTQVVAEVAQEYAIEQSLEEIALNERITNIVDFWFEEVPRENWYSSTPELDADIKARFLQDYEDAVAGNLEHWENRADGALALLLLLDQFSRNMFRGDKKSFAADPKARKISRRAILRNFDQEFDGPERQFFFLPFMHSEKLENQDYGVELYENRSNEASGDALHAKVHREIIRKYKRFPYRNAVLGRKNTKAEQKFLDEGGYASIVKKLKS